MRAGTKKHVYYAEVSLFTTLDSPAWRLVIEPVSHGHEARVEPTHPFPKLELGQKSEGLRVMSKAKDFCEKELKEGKYALSVLRDVEKMITGHFCVTKIGEWVREGG